LLILASSHAAISPVRADNWPRWRGPDGNAVSTATPLPLHWSTTENVRWKTAIPGEGFSSPIVWDDRVFVTSALEKGTRRAVHCLDRLTGKMLWTGEIRDPDPETASAMTGHAAATPVTDGQRVIAFFGNAGVVCYDLAGRQRWHRHLGKFDSELGLASSPVIDRERIFLVCDHDGDRFTSFDSFLIAMDVRTGRECWKTERRGLNRSWSTPLLVPRPGERRELVVSAQDQLRAYDPETGKELWRVDGLTGWVAPSPVFGHGLIFATSGKDGPILAVRPNGAATDRIAWKRDGGGPYVCSPVLYGDYLYVPTEKGILSCYHARSGKCEYQQRIDGRFLASPVAGDGKVYLPNDAGTTFVVKAGPIFELLARNGLKEYSLASPAIAQGQLLLRTERQLYCIGGR
jgi:outer membrane protein assembly factor BamB